MSKNLKTNRRGMKPKIIAGSIITEDKLKEFIEKDCKLLTSKNLAELLGVSEGAIRKQRSKNRSLFPYARLGGRIFYPADLIVSTLHSHLTQSQAR
jgi:hypothetical protein|tara:strand:+ start:632 stop:919 length:288 start_codon:yes stop_codon:yes gene_type:complete